MKTKIAVAILGVLLIGIISASLLTHFGKITGSVEVKGPVFYLTNDTATGEAPAVAYKLLTNNPPSNGGVVNFTDGSGWDAIYFVTEPLGVDEFYQAEFNVHLWVKTNRTSEEPKPLLNITIIRLDGDTMNPICTDSKEIGGKDKHTHNYFSCSSNDIIDMTGTPKFGLKLIGEEGIEYSIQPGNKYTSNGDYDRIEVTAA